MMEAHASLFDSPTAKLAIGLAGAGVFVLLAAILNWKVERAFTGRTRSSQQPPRDRMDLTAIDPAHQNKVDALLEAAGKIRSESAAQDLAELEAFGERHRRSMLYYNNH